MCVGVWREVCRGVVGPWRYTHCAGASSVIKHGTRVAGDDLSNCQKPRKNGSVIEHDERESLEHR